MKHIQLAIPTRSLNVFKIWENCLKPLPANDFLFKNNKLILCRINSLGDL